MVWPIAIQAVLGALQASQQDEDRRRSNNIASRLGEAPQAPANSGNPALQGAVNAGVNALVGKLGGQKPSIARVEDDGLIDPWAGQ